MTNIYKDGIIIHSNIGNIGQIYIYADNNNVIKCKSQFYVIPKSGYYRVTYSSNNLIVDYLSHMFRQINGKLLPSDKYESIINSKLGKVLYKE